MSDDVCKRQLDDLRQAVREHVLEMDGIMRGPASYGRGQEIAKSVSRLEAALSGSTLPASAPTPASSPWTKRVKLSSPAVSTPARKRRNKG